MITFRLKISVPRFVEGRSREDFYGWLWQQPGLVGIHEGTLLSEEAAASGLETDSWTVDSAEAPRERDWVGGSEIEEAMLYFSSDEDARAARDQLTKISKLVLGEIERQEPQDWDAEWKANFLNAGEGVAIPPFWRILPPWTQRETSERVIRINPGAGFGTGTHETTQLCLQLLGESCADLNDKRVLDFGSGSGILSIGAAILGATVDSVEIDELAIDNARENAQINSVDGRIVFSQRLPALAKYPVVLANILRPVLLQFCDDLVARASEVLILSGLIESDVASVVERYSSALPGFHHRVIEKNEWRAILFELRR